MNTVSILTALIPLLAVIAPGLMLLFVSSWRHLTALQLTARTLGSGFIVVSLVTLAAPYAFLSRAQLLILTIALGVLTACRYARTTARLLPYFGVVTVLYAAFSIPYITIHSALPTGDVQKSILWAQRLPDNAVTPDYRVSSALLNRDPVDFYTPALHAVTAALLNVSPHPLSSTGYGAIALGLAVAAIPAALAAELAASPRAAAIYAAVLVLTNLRFLRYLREPGYHFQNLAGELLLWTMLLCVLALIKRYRSADVALLTAAAVTLVLTHQFTAFLVPFVLGAALLAALIPARQQLAALVRMHAPAVLAAIVIMLFVLLLGFTLNLDDKVPHLFTASPHLLPQTPAVLDYPSLLGWLWLMLGLGGTAYLLRTSAAGRRRTAASGYALAAVVLIIFALSQAPRLFIDIPPVRALFYGIVPLSAAAAVMLADGVPPTLRRLHKRWRVPAAATAAVLIGATAYQSAFGAFALSHTVRTNSTLLPEHIPLITAVQDNPGPVLIDDYNRRSASWLVLAGQPMYTRIAADLERQMAEARQSEQRYQLYLAQLDYEKIFSLGSMPHIKTLLNKYNVRYVTGIAGSSATSLGHNPLLRTVQNGGDVTLYAYQPNVAANSSAGQSGATPQIETLVPWLLRTATLANDIGDTEDTFLHLPASLRTTRLSAPQVQGTSTYRITTAPLIPLAFNIDDFVSILWDKERTRQPDTSVELLIQTMTPMPIEVITPTGAKFAGRSHELLKIPAAAVPFDAEGFITLTLVNQDEQPIAFDLIALGLARTP